MNKKPIEEARDPDLRLSVIAMRRAAQRARELAQQTGTVLIVRERGEVQQTPPSIEQARGSLPKALSSGN